MRFRASKGTRVGVLLLGLVLGHPPPVAQAYATKGPGVGADGVPGLSKQLEAGFRTVCTPVDGATQAMFEAEVSRLATALAPLLSPDVDDRVKLEYARLSVARSQFEQSQVLVAAYDDLLEQIALSEQEAIPGILEDLSTRIDDVVSLRASRAAVARLVPGTAGMHLELRSASVASSLEEAVAQAVLREFDLSRSRKAECSDSSVYAFFHTRSLVVRGAEAGDIVRHRDIMALRQRLSRLQKAWTSCASRQSRGCGTPPSIDAVVDLYQAIRDVHERALEVLGQAVALLAGTLRDAGSLSGYEAALVADFPDPAGSDGVPVAVSEAVGAGPPGRDHPPASGGSTLPTQPDSPAEAGEVVTEPRDVAAETAPAEAVVENAERADQDRGKSGGESDGVAAGGDGEPEAETTGGASEAPVPGALAVAHPVPGAPSPSGAAVARKKMDLVNEVMTQANLLRTASSQTYVDPLALAYNLLQRSKRIFRLADMLAVSEQDGRTYRCSVLDGAIRIEFETAERDLARMLVVVDERYQGQKVMTWAISVERKDDRNFAISADFDRMSPAVVVEDGKLVRMPEHQELLVLMNRLSALVYEETGMDEPVRTASR